MSKHSCKIHLVAGTRPNIVKVAPLFRVLREQPWCSSRLIFVQQHDAPNMSTEIFEDFAISEATPLPLLSTGYGPRLGEIIERYQELCSTDRPDLVVVFGDVDVSMAVALAAKRMGVPVAHLEAGLRSRDMSMPEEINRTVIDSISDIMLAPSEDALHNLVFAEGKPSEKVEFVGNIMIDSLQGALDAGLQARLLAEYGLARRKYAVATFHRPSNVDTLEALSMICELLTWLAKRMPVLFPAHPRTARELEKSGLATSLHKAPGMKMVPALRYSSFVNLVAASAFVLTDSGGIQEEASYLGIPCLTFRDTTERPITVRLGTNSLVNAFDVRARLESLLARPDADNEPRPASIPLWDGATAYRCAAVLRRWWQLRNS